VATINGNKVFLVDFEDESSLKMGLSKISLVKQPAVKELFVALSKQIKIYLDDDKQILTGPLLIPDQPIERYTKELGTFYIVFTKQVIAKIARNLHLKNIGFNYEHNPEAKVDGVLQEVWLSGGVDKSQALGYNLPEGTLFGSVYIKDKNFWLSEIKTKNVLGFSIEALMDLIEINMKEIKLAEITTADGLVIKTDAETFEKGVDVYTEDESGTKTPVTDGEYDLGNGMRMIVVEGKVADMLQMSDEDKEKKEEEVAMKALIDPFILPLQEKIEAQAVVIEQLKTQLSQIPGTLVKEKKEEPVKLKTSELFMRALEKQKEKQKTKQN
jgi:hypothetical protein